LALSTAKPTAFSRRQHKPSGIGVQKLHLASFGFDISAPGLNLICAAQAKGEWSGKPVRSALVVLTDRLEVFRHYTTEEIRDRVSGIPAHFWVPEEKW